MHLPIKKWPLVFFLFLFCLSAFTGKGLLTGLMEKMLYKAITDEARVVENLQLDLAPLGVFNLLSGNIPGLSLSATRFAFKDGPAFDNLVFVNKGMEVSASALWFERKMEVKSFADTQLSFCLSQEELTEAISIDLPQWEPRLIISPEGIRLEGKIKVMGHGVLPFYAVAQIEQASENTLRLTPTEISLAGLNFITGFLKDYRQELTWLYPLHLPWPLQISGFKLDYGFLEMKWKDRTELKAGD